MSTMSDRLDVASKTARRVKEEHVREVKGKRGRTDIPTVVQSWRGDQPVAFVFAPPDRDRMLQIARMSAGGFAADMIVLVMETYQVISETMDNPDTGKQWALGDMHEYAQKHGPDNGVVIEALMLQAFNRAGDEAAKIMPYRITGRVVEWGDDSDIDEMAGGNVPEAMRGIMNEQTSQQTLGAAVAALRLDSETSLAAGDAATITAFQSVLDADVAVMLWAKPGSKRHGTLRRFLPASAIRDLRDLS